MPSMQYCMFQNTVLEMQQIIDTMADAEYWADLDLSLEETRAKHRLFDLCQNYIEAYNHFTDMEESYDEE